MFLSIILQNQPPKKCETLPGYSLIRTGTISGGHINRHCISSILLRTRRPGTARRTGVLLRQHPECHEHRGRRRPIRPVLGSARRCRCRSVWKYSYRFYRIQQFCFFLWIVEFLLAYSGRRCEDDGCPPGAAVRRAVHKRQMDRLFECSEQIQHTQGA